MYKIGIIVPVYNIKNELLERCIKSLVLQSYTNIEIIIVDDGSNIECAVSCDKLASTDDRIKVVHQKNGGLSNARNVGVGITKSDYFMFVDADDWLELDICERLVAIIVDSYDVIVFGEYRNFDNYEEKIPQPLFREEPYKNEEIDVLRGATLQHDMFISTAHGKLYKTSVIHQKNIYHDDELRSGIEGVEYCYRMFDSVSTVKITDEVGYHYYYNNESLSAMPSAKSNYLTLLGLRKIGEYIERNGYIEDIETLEKRTVYVTMAIATRSIFNPKNRHCYKEKKNNLYAVLDNELVKKALNTQKTREFSIKKWPLIIMLKRKLTVCLSLYSYLSYIARNKR